MRICTIIFCIYIYAFQSRPGVYFFWVNAFSNSCIFYVFTLCIYVAPNRYPAHMLFWRYLYVFYHLSSIRIISHTHPPEKHNLISGLHSWASPRRKPCPHRQRLLASRPGLVVRQRRPSRRPAHHLARRRPGDVRLFIYLYIRLFRNSAAFSLYVSFIHKRDYAASSENLANVGVPISSCLL